MHETLAGYPKLALDDANNVMELLELSLKVAKGVDIESSDTLAGTSDHHSVDGWNNLLSLIID